MKINSPVLGDVTLRNDIYRIVAVSISGNDFGYTLCSGCLYKRSKHAKWRTYRSTIWAKDNLTCQDCGAMTHPTFERLSLETHNKQKRKGQNNGTQGSKRDDSRK